MVQVHRSDQDERQMTSDDIDRGTTRAITITGSRVTDQHDQEHYDELFAAFLGPFAEAATRFYLGGAVGIDTLALEWLVARTRASIVVTVPATVADQPFEAREAIESAYASGRLQSIVELAAPELSTSAYHARNRWMVDRSRFVIGFPRTEDPRSGTRYTLDYAANSGKPRLIVPI